MKQHLFILLFLVISLPATAQVIKPYSQVVGYDHQSIMQSFVDHAGNCYQVVGSFSRNVGSIDSVGTPIFLLDSVNPTALVKYNVEGIYQYDIKLPAQTGSAQRYGEDICSLRLLFDNDNNLYINFTQRLVQQDTVMALYHANGIYFKDINLKSDTDKRKHTTFFCKISPSGEFQWINSIENHERNIDMLLGVRYEQYPGVITHNGDVCLYYDNYRSNHTQNNDSIFITDNNNQQIIITASSRDVILKFSTAGNFISFNEPYKGRLDIPQADTIGEGFHQMISDGQNTFTLHRFYSPVNNIFNCATPVTLKPGINFLLIKTNEQDSIVWARSIGVDDYVYPFYSYYIDFNEQKNELIYAMQFYPALFSFTHDPSLRHNAYDTDIYLSRLDASSGNVKWYKSYRGTQDDAVNSFTYNKKTNELLLVGRTISPDLVLDNHLMSTYNGLYPRYYISTIDSNNIIQTSQFIKSYRACISNISMGYPITDTFGRSYVSGWFYDSIQTSCNTMINSVPYTERNYEICDGFSIALYPIIIIDTNICNSMTSPSGRYTWDSTGLYYDTLQNSAGCDSILMFRLKILRTSSAIDTAVCKQMQSISGKYLWATAGVYSDTINNARGCDSIITVHLSILQSSATFDTTVSVFYIPPSLKYSWDSSGVYVDTIPNRNGCDSIVTIRLKVKQTKSFIDTSVCTTYKSPSGKYVFTLPGIYLDTIPNVSGGDSILTIRLNTLQTYATLHFNSCDSMISPSGRFTYFIPGTYSDTIVNTMGCDSILTIHYGKLNSVSDFEKTVCTDYTSPSGNYIYTSSGNYQDTIKNQMGCDSIISIRLIIEPLVISVSKSNDLSCDTPFVLLNASGGTYYEWLPDYYLSDATIDAPVARPEIDTMYYVKVKDTLGCEITDSIKVNVKKDETLNSLPNVFTPNNDGLNDCLDLSFVAAFKNIELIIFNRWGIMVFSTGNINDCWNGKDLSGNDLPSGVYYYVLKGISLCDSKIEQQGTITMIR